MSDSAIGDELEKLLIDYVDTDHSVSMFKQHLKSYVEEQTKLARIDELSHISPTAYYYDGTGDYELVSDRKARLEASIKERSEDERS